MVTWFIATSVRAIQLGLDLDGIAPVTTVLALYFIGLVFSTIALLLHYRLEGGPS